jgi:hypothetical protein
MTEFNEIINTINKRIDNRDLQFYTKEIIKEWFTELNIKDIEILSIMGTYLIIRITKLFISNEDYLRQLKKNNNQDIKSILLLLLPYINDNKINVYKKLKDLNELILTQELIPSDYNLERVNILNSHFKYTNVGIGLIDVENKLELQDVVYGKLIYKILYHNFIGLNETLSIINGKLYVNWLNIYPVTENNYKESNIYKNTMANIDTVVNNLINHNYDELYDYNGLYIGEFYNVFRNIYYESIKKIKWLIFIIKGKYIIQYLNDIFNFNLLLQYNSFDDLNVNDKDIFITTLKNNFNNDYLLVWKNILLFFVNNYSLRNIVFKDDKIKETVNKFKINIDNEASDEDLLRKDNEKFNNIEDNEILFLLNNIEGKHIWNFIKENLILFQSTIYSDYLINDNKITDFVNFKDSDLNLKNIYNIAKSLSHISKNDWILQPIKYTSLSIGKQKMFWAKFNLDITVYHVNEWINLRSNIKLEKGIELSLFEYNNIMTNKLEKFKEIKYDLVWNYLVKNGILSDFQTNFEITDSKEYGIDRTKKIQKYFKKNIEKYEDGYYYLTNKKYKDHKFRVNVENTSLLKKLDTYKWYTFYAMDWISQIGFYHHYLNHRILYITGATGQGKSTQVPKLFMYSLKMLDYKSNGKVICTQPRIGPTNGNATRISDELGVPIEQYSLSLKDKIKSDNYYVQLSHSSDKHTKTLCNHLTLKVITDGTLLGEIIKNPFLKEEINTYEKNSNTYNTLYTETNKYDVIIVDEAHEHNTNMDLILTLNRHSCFINNDLKLVIMSATMDDDEPHFRSYYNIINDNLVYPLREKSFKYFSGKTDLFFYDSIYLDRRFHIAPPGQSTQYNIVENYEPNSETNKLVKEILESSSFGDILIFENGTNDIIKRITSLNKIIPNNVIALPYFSSLNIRYKLFIESGLEKNLKELKIDKNKVVELWNEKYVESNDVVEGTYSRCIIVATNVAEASITLENLKFVIDNGFAKVNSYDYVMDITKLEPEEISEASKKQRKGRVGRVSSGTVYYLYEKGSREKNKPKYKITQENFGYSLIKLLETKKNTNQRNELLQISSYDPNVYIIFKQNYNARIREDIAKTSLFYKKNLYNIIKKQYFSNDYLIYWDEKYFRHMSRNNLKYMYKSETGFTLYELLDYTGLFYIIHPFENFLKRNIKGDIISYSVNNIEYKMKDKISDTIFSNMLLNLNQKYLLVDLKLSNLSFINNDVDLNYYIKTEFVNIINDMDENLSWSEKTIEDTITILTSKAYGSFNDVLEILILIKIIQGTIKNLFINLKIPNNYISQDNEIELLYNIILNFKKSFSYFNIFNIKSYDTLENKYKYDAEILVQNFLVDYKKNKLDPPKNKYSIKLWNKLSKAYHNGSLKAKEGFMTYVGDMFSVTDQIYNFRNYNEEIKLWAINKNIESKILINFLENYTSILLEILTIKKNFNPNKNELDPLEKMEIESTSFTKSLTGTNDLEHIIRPFLHGKPFNIALKLKTHGSYKTIPPVNVINSSKPNNGKLLFYFNKIDSLDKRYTFSINITNKIDIRWLFSALPYYYKPQNFKNEIVKKSDNIYKIYEIYGDLYDDFCAEMKNKWSLQNIPFESTELPILKEFMKNLKKSTLYN